MTEGFFDLIFGNDKGIEGYVYVALFNGGKPTKRTFLHWPTDRAKLNSLHKQAHQGDIYFSPALYNRRSATRQAALGTLVTWADVDATAATGASPALRVASGTPGHEHVYWRAGRLLDPSQAEAWNYHNVLLCGADKSGWDVTQLLRVPGTLNHKTDPPLPVELTYSSNELAEMPDLTGVKVPVYKKPDILPKLETILDRHDFDDTVLQLLQLQNAPDRSNTMFRLACLLSERGLSANESYVIIEHCDSRWGKFVGRSDRELRLSQLIARAYERSLSVVDDSEGSVGSGDGPKADSPFAYDPLKPVGWGDLAKNIPPMKWVIKDILMEGGLMIVGGPTNIGKSQAAVNLSAKLVLGAKQWAGFKVETKNPQKILYLSLEMNQHVIKLMTDKMQQPLPIEAIETLTTNLLFIATIGNFHLDITPRLKLAGKTHHKVPRERLEEYIKAIPGLTGVVIDTVGAATSRSLQEESSVREVTAWIKDSLRDKLGLWVLLLVHPRKEAAGQKRKELSMDDLYGSRVLGDEADTVFALLPIQGSNQLIALQNLKARFAAKEGNVILRRSEHLWLERTNESLPMADKSKIQDDEIVLVDDDFDPDDAL